MMYEEALSVQRDHPIGTRLLRPISICSGSNRAAHQRRAAPVSYAEVSEHALHLFRVRRDAPRES
jgi:hypothetical protein